MPRTMPSTRNSTFVTSMLSEASADIITVPATVDPSMGDVIEAMGGIMSGVGVGVGVLVGVGVGVGVETTGVGVGVGVGALTNLTSTVRELGV